MSALQHPLLLRDGSAVRFRRARPADLAALHAFVERLRAEESETVALAFASRPDLDARALCESEDPSDCLTLLAIRTLENEDRVVAAASYVVVEGERAEIALGVDPAFRSKGLASRVVERLALAAAHHDIRELTTTAAGSNRRLLEVLRRSGFPQEEAHAADGVTFNLAVAPHAAGRARSELRERLATAASLRPFFHPRAVAVIGASRDPESLGSRTLHGLVLNRFEGPVYAINPRARSIGAIPAYGSVGDLPGPVDLAIILVPKQFVAEVIDECAAVGVRAVVVITAGFAETGPEGRVRQDELLAKVRAHGMRMVGPNCMGLVNTDPEVRLAATFAPVFPPAGNVAMSSQSGALGLAILATARELGIGFSTFVSVGNKADVSGNDLLQYWEEDERTDVILLYVESFGNPRRFGRIARRVGARKPIVVVKSGRTGAGKSAAASHTAALAGSDIAVDALFHQTGVLRAETLEGMFDLALVLSSQPLPRGRRIALLTNAGGPAILCADACEAHGLVIRELSTPVREALGAFLPEEASSANPVDMIASAGAEEYRRATELLLAAEEVDALIVLYAPIEASQLAPVEEAIQEVIASLRTGKPVITCMIGEGGRGAARQLRGGIPSFTFPEAAARVLGKVADYADWRRKPPGVLPAFEAIDGAAARAVCRKALDARGSGWLEPDEVRDVLGAFQLPLVTGHTALTAAGAISAADDLGYPVALKLISSEIVHKSDAGGVLLDLPDAEGVEAAFNALQARLAADGKAEQMDGVLIQPMLRAGVEVMAGMTEDPVFGPLIAFGLGGIHVEILGDVVFRVAPLTERDASEMVEGIRGRRLLDGYRGHEPADIEAIKEVLLRISALAEAVPDIDDLDLNPLFALKPGEGCRIVDARIHVRRPHA